MGTRDARVDAYIAKQKDFAQPILTHLRDVVHAACPDVEETIKWSSPFFDYKGQPMCQMAAFKEHAAFGFWKAPLIEGLGPNFNNGGEAAGNVGRITAVKDLPSKKVLTGFIKAAMKLNDEGVVVAKKKAVAKPAAKVPPELVSALAKNKKAKAAFDAFSASHKREYVEWIAEAKREETRAKRVAQAVEWIAEGKSRNWKYQSMRQTTKAIATVFAVITLGAGHLAAQTGESQQRKEPHRLLILAHSDPVSRELAAAVRSRLASDRRYELVAERTLTRAERPVDASADSTLSQQRALAVVLRAEAFISIDASRLAERPGILAIRSISDSDIVDAVNVPSGGAPAEIARTLVDRLLPHGWPSRTR